MHLTSPTFVGALTVPNRVVMAPMTRNRAPDAVPTALMAEYYRQRASAGLLITEATQVDPMGQGYPDTPGVYTDEQTEAWQHVTEAVHAAGGRIFLQLWHVGRISHSSYHDGALPAAPSAIRPDGKVLTPGFEQVPYETPHALETDEIPEIVAQYRQGAERALDAGFDGVEVHGANGYLLDQFLQSGSNQRTDRYGGSVENRSRLLLEVTDAVVDVWGSSRVGVRLSPAGTFNSMHDDDPIETFGYAVRQLDERGLAYLHLIDGDLGGQRASTFVRETYDGTLMAAGGYDRESGEAALEEGRLDLVAYARLFLANPDLPRRFAEAAPLNDWDRSTFYGGGAKGYIDYPSLEEQRMVQTA